MPRPQQRVRLESGLKLDLNRLARRGFVRPGAYMASRIRWTDGYTGEDVASGTVTADMTSSACVGGWFRIRIEDLDQHIKLDRRPRHFGGHQYYFVCPYTNRRVSVLWMPPGAPDFACRQRWGRQVAYSSQFCDRVGRAHRGKARINSRLCSLGGFDPDEWDFPPKPKWMRWRTYHALEAKFDDYEAILDEGTLALVARFMATK